MTAWLLASGVGWASDGAGLFEAGKFDEARQAFLEVLSKNPDDPEAMYYMGLLTTEGALSRRFFERLLARHPNNALADDALFELAEADYADPNGRYLSARQRYLRLIARYPDSPHIPAAYYRIGLTYLVVLKPDSALAAFDHAAGDSASTWAQQARLGSLEALAMMGRREEALHSAQAWLDAGAGDLQTEVQGLVDRLRPEDAALTPDSTAAIRPIFWVQVGAFSNARNVAALKVRLRQAGFLVSVTTREGSDLQIVFTGPYRDREAAERDRLRISKQENLPCVVTDKQ